MISFEILLWGTISYAFPSSDFSPLLESPALAFPSVNTLSPSDESWKLPEALVPWAPDCSEFAKWALEVPFSEFPTPFEASFPLASKSWWFIPKSPSVDVCESDSSFLSPEEVL